MSVCADGQNAPHRDGRCHVLPALHISMYCCVLPSMYCGAEWVREMYAWDAACAVHKDKIKILTDKPPNSTTIVQVRGPA